MVGVARSGRCDNCRKRKIKCDEVRPACHQCLRAGWKCPGYSAKNWQFQNKTLSGLKHVRSRTSSDRKPTAENACYTRVASDQDNLSKTVAPLYIPWSDSEQLCSKFCWSIDHDRLAAKLSFLPARPYLEFLPAYVGYDQALDDAISCTLLINQPSVTDNGHTFRMEPTRHGYSQALQSLRLSLGNSKTLQPTTLAAVMLLLMFESYTDPDGQSTVIHANGLVAALRRAGPQGLSSELSRVVLNASLGTIVFGSMIAGKETFLNSPAWRRLLKSHEPHSRILGLMRDVCLAISPFSGLIERYHSVNAFEQIDGYANDANWHHETMTNVSQGHGKQQLIDDIRNFQSTTRDWIFNDLDPKTKDESKPMGVKSSPGLESQDYLSLCLSFRCASKIGLLLSKRMIDRMEEKGPNVGTRCVALDSDNDSTTILSEPTNTLENLRLNSEINHDLELLETINVTQAYMMRCTLAILSAKVG